VVQRRDLWQRARDLDDRVLGRPVPDNRPLMLRVLRPRPAVWTRRGRVAGALIVLAMFTALMWAPTVLAICIVVALLAGGFVLVAAEERQRATAHQERDG
jgi:hypothetical protein